MRAVARVMVLPLMVLGLSLLPGVTPFLGAESARASSGVVGDIDCGGAVSAVDAAAVLRDLAGMDDGCQPGLADVNCSAALDVGDVLLIRRSVAGLPSGAPAGCPAIGGSLEPTGSDSAERIEQALLDGKITKGRALLLQLYAELDRPLLPLPFWGPVDEHAPLESSLFDEVASSWSTLSASEKDALRPYLLPPAEPGSWADEGGFELQSVQWETVSNTRIKVWWRTDRPGDAAKAAAILQELDSKIWPKLVEYMGGAAREPLPDLGQKGDGGDDRYDIYLVHNISDDPATQPVLGWVSSMLDAADQVTCKMTPTYMVLNSRVPLTQEFYSTVAHEFMHSVQATYDIGSCQDYRWMKESTATWVESWLYPTVNTEHGFAFSYLDQIDKKPLEYWAYRDSRQYGSYLLWYHAQHNEGLFDAVRDAWDASSDPNSLVAVNAGLEPAGGLEIVWPESALYNWNREPYEDFSDNDGLFAAAPWVETEVTAGNAPTSYPVPTDVGHLQQRHLAYTIDSSVKRLTFINPFSGNYDPHAKVQALLNIDGQWQSEAVDWTNEDRVSFCFDRRGEKVDQLVIIITNSNHLDRKHVLDAGPGELVATPTGCNGWVGSATASVQYFDTTFNITVDNLRFAPDPDNPGNERYDFYELEGSGTAAWTVTGSWFGCTPSGTMTLGAPNSGDTEIRGYFHVDKLNNTYTLHINGHDHDSSLVITCPGSDPWALPWPVIAVTWDGATWRPIPDDNVISGEFIDPSQAYGGTWQWNFTLLE